jgi:hypothetical protein
MPAVLTTGSRVVCDHQGTATTQGAPKLKVQGNPALLASDATSWPITLCTQTGGPPTPCSNITSVLAGRANKLRIGGQAVLLATLSGPTNGAPPGTASAQANQSKLIAS